MMPMTVYFLGCVNGRVNLIYCTREDGIPMSNLFFQENRVLFHKISYM